MFKKGALSKTWKFLSTLATAFTIYKQINSLKELSENAEEYFTEEEKVSFQNPTAKTQYSQSERVGTGV